MRKPVLSILFVVVLLAVGAIAEAQQPVKITRIGYVDAVSISVNAARVERSDRV